MTVAAGTAITLSCLLMPTNAAALFDAAHEALSQVVESGARIGNLNETETRQHVIGPILHALGYRSLDHLRAWLSAGFWGMGTSTPHRRHFNAGDRCCFYARGVGVVAHATIAATADQPVTREEYPGLDTWHEELFKVPLRAIQWLETPVRIDTERRGQLDAFDGRDLARPWGWFVQSTNHVTKHDFSILFGEGTTSA